MWRIEQAPDGSWTVTRADGTTIVGFTSAVEASAAADGLVASAAATADAVETDDPEVITAAITAATVDVPARPPAQWFDDPEFNDASTVPSPTCSDIRGCPLTITDEGQVYGHAALWSSCHVGFPDQCVTPPRSPSGYAMYRVGSTLTADGSNIPTGIIAVGTGHAPMNASGDAAVAHYDNTGTAVADVATGEDQYGIWVAGAIRPGASVSQVEALRRSSLSGDWRDDGQGNLEMRGLLAVNTPGFAVSRFGLAASAGSIPKARARVVDGRALALVAAGSETLARIAAAPWAAGDEQLAQRLEVLEKWMANSEPAIRPLAASAARERLSAALGDVAVE
jgi:hypothetical protein